jgi:hypothetical protein
MDVVINWLVRRWLTGRGQVLDITIFGLKGFENFGKSTILLFPYICLYLRATIYEMFHCSIRYLHCIVALLLQYEWLHLRVEVMINVSETLVKELWILY